MLLSELHCHSIYSYDGYNSVNDIITECKSKGINAIAITDHDTIKISTRDKKSFDENCLTLIPGVEMTTDHQVHIIGLFINQIPERINLWQKTLSDRQIEIFESQTADLLSLLDYQTQYGTKARPVTLKETLVYAIKDSLARIKNRYHFRSSIIKQLE